MKKTKKKLKRATCVACGNRRICAYGKLVYEDGADAGRGWCCSYCKWN